MTQQKIIRLFKLLPFLLLIFQINAFSKPLDYEIDKFTGERYLKQSIWFGYEDGGYLLTGSNEFILEFSKEPNKPFVTLLKTSLAGMNCTVDRADPNGNYNGKAELLLLVNGEKINVPITRIDYISSQKIEKYVGLSSAFIGNARVTNGSGVELKQQNIVFNLDFPLSLLQKISTSKKVEGSFREHFPSTTCYHPLNFTVRKLRDIRSFAEALSK